MLRCLFIILYCLNVDCFGNDYDLFKLDHEQIYADFYKANCFRFSDDGDVLSQNGNLLFREDHQMFTQLITFEEGLPQELRDRLDLKGKTVDNIRNSYLTRARIVSGVLASPNAREGVVQIMSEAFEGLLTQKEGTPKDVLTSDLEYVLDVRRLIAIQDFNGFVFHIQRIGFDAVPVWGKETAIHILKMGFSLFICDSYQLALKHGVEFKDFCGDGELDQYQWVMGILNSSEATTH